jgi:lactate dehydrogenase-like 2-hydroxyacid dehydrogenase
MIGRAFYLVAVAGTGTNNFDVAAAQAANIRDFLAGGRRSRVV